MTDYSEEYYVLASDKKIRHGSYIKLTKSAMDVYNKSYFSLIGNYAHGKKDGLWEEYYLNSNNIKSRGYYTDGKKDSIWLHFYSDETLKQVREVQTEEGIRAETINLNDRLSSKGSYSKGAKVGVWTYYDLQQQPLQVFDYNRDTLLLHDQYKDTRDKPVTFIGGEYEMYRTFYDLMDFSETMDRINTRRSIETGRITLSIEVDRKGKLTEIEVVQNEIGNKKLLKQVLYLANEIDEGYWSPKYEDGIPQTSSVKLHFILDVKKTSRVHTYGVSTSTRMQFTFDLDNE
ncbi:MAG: hypothetical protein WBB45_08060 [Cyclobacteriaceae bacterium]